jgi:hypothetical protein
MLTSRIPALFSLSFVSVIITKCCRQSTAKLFCYYFVAVFDHQQNAVSDKQEDVNRRATMAKEITFLIYCLV